MANWGNAKNVTVVSHEHIEDKDPDTYIARGLKLLANKQYAEAENEYLKAVKFSGTDDKYVSELLQFYYASGLKDFKKKANQIFHDWFRKQKEYKSYKIFFWGCIILGLMSLLVVASVEPSLCVIVLPLVGIATILSVPQSFYALYAKSKMSQKLPGFSLFLASIRLGLRTILLALYFAGTVGLVFFALLFSAIGG